MTARKTGEDISPEHIASRIKELIKDSGLSFSDIGESCGVTRAAAHHWTKSGQISTTHLARLAKVLGVSSEDILDIERPTSTPYKPRAFTDRFTRRTRLLRESAGLSQPDVAGDLGIPLKTYQKYETRSCMPHHLIPNFLNIVAGSYSMLFGPQGRRDSQME